jgi:hypothetical protein
VKSNSLETDFRIVDLFELNMADHSSSAKMTPSIYFSVPVNLINGLAVNLHR